MKRKYFKEVDRLEEWKINIMNRPIIDEMSKVKQLNMTGETETLFENWRNEWDDIVTKQLPDVEEYLFDLEEYIDKYRFNKAQSVKRTIEQHLNKTEENIQELLDEIKKLVGSEEKNRIEIEELKEEYRLSKKNLLAHLHHFGKAEKSIELQLQAIMEKFQEFEERTNHGDYLKARESVFIIQAMMQELNRKMELIPNLLVECQSKIPSELANIREGYREMLKEEYILDHLQMEKELERIESELQLYIQSLENSETDEVEQGLHAIKESVELLYDLLEKEVAAKQYIQVTDDVTKNLLHDTLKANNQLQVEIEHVKESYHLSEQQLQTQGQLEKKLSELVKRYELLDHKISNDITAYSLLQEELSGIKDQLETISSELSALTDSLHTLRKDELAAREQVQHLTRTMADTMKVATKSNLPGLPEDYLQLAAEAKESIQNVRLKLEEKPLNIPAVQQYLEIAVMTVEKMSETTNELVETVMLVERVIQYGNRYRSRYASIEDALNEAEISFRNFDYQTALEQAATSVEEVEPGALKRIEAILEQENKSNQEKVRVYQ